MLKQHILIAAPFVLVFGACRDYDRTDTTEERARAAETMESPRVGGDTLGDDDDDVLDLDADRGTGVFDRDETDDVDEDSIMIPEESARVGLSDQQVIERFRADIKGDPDLANEKADLVLKNGKLTLEGEVSSEDVGEAIEEYAEELADDRDIQNNLKSPMKEDPIFNE